MNAQKFEPKDGLCLVFIGQDLEAVGCYTYIFLTSDTTKSNAQTTLKTIGVILEEGAKITYQTGKYIVKSR